MKKIALLIGISQYQPYFQNLPSAEKDAKAMQKILQDPNIGIFEEEDIILLIPELIPEREREGEAETYTLSEQKIQSEIYELFANKESDDLLLLYFSGNAFINSKGNLFLVATDTKKYEYGGELIESTAIPASFIHKIMDNSKSEKKVVILDCCFTGTFKSDDVTKNPIDFEAQLGSKGRRIIASSNSIDYPFKEDEELSIFTTYFIEGIKTGAANKNPDNWITLEEIYDYTKEKLEQYPNMIPSFNPSEVRDEIQFAKVNPNSIDENNISLFPHLHEIELQSQRGVDYTKLRELLDNGDDWEEADKETRRVLLLAAGKQENEFIREEDINQISCLDLNTIDNLWCAASNGWFGFSSQKDICEQLIQKNDIDYETECELGEKLGWRVNNAWLIHSQLTFNLDASKGHLPCLGISLVRIPGSFGGPGRVPIFSLFLKKFTQCE